MPSASWAITNENYRIYSFLQTKIIHHSSVPKRRGRGISDPAAVVMHHKVMAETYCQSMLERHNLAAELWACLGLERLALAVDLSGDPAMVVPAHVALDKRDFLFQHGTVHGL
jgi:hypothetical protein